MMTKFHPVLAIAMPLTLLAACGPADPRRGLETVHQPVVQRTDYTIDLQTAGDRLAPGESSRLGGWMEAMRVAYGDRISIDDPSRYAAGARDDVAAEAARYGLLLVDTAPVTTGQVQPGTVRVVLSRSSAAVPSCPDFSDSYKPNFNGATAANYGCASNSNLAAMIANPDDLVRGQPGSIGGSDPGTSTKAIGTYRRAAPTGAGGLKSESTGSN